MSFFIAWFQHVLLNVDTNFGVARFKMLGEARRARTRIFLIRHKWLRRSIALSALALNLAWLGWRIAFSLTNANIVLGIGLLVVEIYTLWSLIMITVYNWSPHWSSRPPIKMLHSVDIVICTYDEPNDVLRPTILGAMGVTYPHTTYVCDDGRRPEVQHLAESLGANYLTRDDNRHAKAGNINAALPKLGGELVLILDADHVAMPDALDALVGYFDDPDVAVVQSPHDFFNQDSIQHYGKFRHEQSVFYHVIMPGEDSFGSAFWCGSAALLRRKALISVGGVATETIAEDFHTTLKMLRAGWKSRYHNEILVQGMAPPDLNAYLLQRDRWARGNLAVFRTSENPITARGLTLTQRICSTESLLAYLSGPIRFLLLGILAGTLWTGQIPLEAHIMLLIALWAPTMTLSALSASLLGEGFSLSHESIHFDQCTGEIFTKALKSAFVETDRTFKVTPKETADIGGLQALTQLKWLVGITGILFLGLVVRTVQSALGVHLLPALPPSANWIVPALTVMELRRLLRSLLLLSKRRQRRNEFRFPVSLEGRIIVNHKYFYGTVSDLGVSGSRFVSSSPILAQRGNHVELSIEFPSGSARIFGEVAAVVGNPGASVLGIRTTKVSEEDRNVIALWCYVYSSFMYLRGDDALELLPFAQDAKEIAGSRRQLAA